MNRELCEFLLVGGWMLLDSDQERDLLPMRPKLLALRVPLMYETLDEFQTRKGRNAPYEARLVLWRPLREHELKRIRCQ